MAKKISEADDGQSKVNDWELLLGEDLIERTRRLGKEGESLRRKVKEASLISSQSTDDVNLYRGVPSTALLDEKLKDRKFKDSFNVLKLSSHQNHIRYIHHLGSEALKATRTDEFIIPATSLNKKLLSLSISPLKRAQISSSGEDKSIKNNDELAKTLLHKAMNNKRSLTLEGFEEEKNFILSIEKDWDTMNWTEEMIEASTESLISIFYFDLISKNRDEEKEHDLLMLRDSLGREAIEKIPPELLHYLLEEIKYSRMGIASNMMKHLIDKHPAVLNYIKRNIESFFTHSSTKVIRKFKIKAISLSSIEDHKEENEEEDDSPQSLELISKLNLLYILDLVKDKFMSEMSMFGMVGKLIIMMSHEAKLACVIIQHYYRSYKLKQKLMKIFKKKKERKKFLATQFLLEQQEREKQELLFQQEQLNQYHYDEQNQYVEEGYEPTQDLDQFESVDSFHTAPGFGNESKYSISNFTKVPNDLPQSTFSEKLNIYTINNFLIMDETDLCNTFDTDVEVYLRQMRVIRVRTLELKEFWNTLHNKTKNKESSNKYFNMHVPIDLFNIPEDLKVVLYKHERSHHILLGNHHLSIILDTLLSLTSKSAEQYSHSNSNDFLQNQGCLLLSILVNKYVRNVQAFMLSSVTSMNNNTKQTFEYEKEKETRETLQFNESHHTFAHKSLMILNNVSRIPESLIIMLSSDTVSSMIKIITVGMEVSLPLCFADFDDYYYLEKLNGLRISMIFSVNVLINLARHVAGFYRSYNNYDFISPADEIEEINYKEIYISDLTLVRLLTNGFSKSSNQFERSIFDTLKNNTVDSKPGSDPFLSLICNGNIINVFKKMIILYSNENLIMLFETSEQILLKCLLFLIQLLCTNYHDMVVYFLFSSDFNVSHEFEKDVLNCHIVSESNSEFVNILINFLAHKNSTIASLALGILIISCSRSYNRRLLLREKMPEVLNSLRKNINNKYNELYESNQDYNESLHVYHLRESPWLRSAIISIVLCRQGDHSLYNPDHFISLLLYDDKKKPKHFDVNLTSLLDRDLAPSTFSLDAGVSNTKNISSEDLSNSIPDFFSKSFLQNFIYIDTLQTFIGREYKGYPFPEALLINSEYYDNVNKKESLDLVEFSLESEDIKLKEQDNTYYRYMNAISFKEFLGYNYELFSNKYKKELKMSNFKTKIVEEVEEKLEIPQQYRFNIKNDSILPHEIFPKLSDLLPLPINSFRSLSLSGMLLKTCDKNFIINLLHVMMIFDSYSSFDINDSVPILYPLQFATAAMKLLKSFTPSRSLAIEIFHPDFLLTISHFLSISHNLMQRSITLSSNINLINSMKKKNGALSFLNKGNNTISDDESDLDDDEEESDEKDKEEEEKLYNKMIGNSTPTDLELSKFQNELKLLRQNRANRRRLKKLFINMKSKKVSSSNSKEVADDILFDDSAANLEKLIDDAYETDYKSIMGMSNSSSGYSFIKTLVRLDSIIQKKQAKELSSTHVYILLQGVVDAMVTLSRFCKSLMLPHPLFRLKISEMASKIYGSNNLNSSKLNDSNKNQYFNDLTKNLLGLQHEEYDPEYILKQYRISLSEGDIGGRNDEFSFDNDFNDELWTLFEEKASDTSKVTSLSLERTTFCGCKVKLNENTSNFNSYYENLKLCPSCYNSERERQKNIITFFYIYKSTNLLSSINFFQSSLLISNNLHLIEYANHLEEERLKKIKEESDPNYYLIQEFNKSFVKSMSAEKKKEIEEKKHKLLFNKHFLGEISFVQFLSGLSSLHLLTSITDLSNECMFNHIADHYVGLKKSSKEVDDIEYMKKRLINLKKKVMNLVYHSRIKVKFEALMLDYSLSNDKDLDKVKQSLLFIKDNEFFLIVQKVKDILVDLKSIPPNVINSLGSLHSSIQATDPLVKTKILDKNVESQNQFLNTFSSSTVSSAPLNTNNNTNNNGRNLPIIMLFDGVFNFFHSASRSLKGTYNCVINWKILDCINSFLPTPHSGIPKSKLAHSISEYLSSTNSLVNSSIHPQILNLIDMPSSFFSMLSHFCFIHEGVAKICSEGYLRRTLEKLYIMINDELKLPLLLSILDDSSYDLDNPSTFETYNNLLNNAVILYIKYEYDIISCLFLIIKAANYHNKKIGDSNTLILSTQYNLIGLVKCLLLFLRYYLQIVSDIKKKSINKLKKSKYIWTRYYQNNRMKFHEISIKSNNENLKMFTEKTHRSFFSKNYNSKNEMYLSKTTSEEEEEPIDNSPSNIAVLNCPLMYTVIFDLFSVLSLDTYAFHDQLVQHDLFSLIEGEFLTDNDNKHEIVPFKISILTDFNVCKHIINMVKNSCNNITSKYLSRYAHMYQEKSHSAVSRQRSRHSISRQSAPKENEEMKTNSQSIRQILFSIGRFHPSLSLLAQEANWILTKSSLNYQEFTDVGDFKPIELIPMTDSFDISDNLNGYVLPSSSTANEIGVKPEAKFVKKHREKILSTQDLNLGDEDFPNENFNKDFNETTKTQVPVHSNKLSHIPTLPSSNVASRNTILPIPTVNLQQIPELLMTRPPPRKK